MTNKNIHLGQNLKKLILFAVILGLCVVSARDTFAAAHCWCLLSCANLSNNKTASMVVKDYGQLATYTGLNQQSDKNQTACNTLCTDKAAPDTGSQSIAAAACSLGCPSGSTVRAWSKVGTREYKSSQYIGTLTNTPAVVKYKCPPGWTCNGCSPQVDGGFTSDGKCKKVACHANTISPFPPDGTQIGTWGFSWGNAFHAWGTTANGGAPATIVVSPAQCHF